MLVLAEAVRRAGYKVVLTGEGADEVFGGLRPVQGSRGPALRRAPRRARRGRPALFERLYPYLPQAAALGSRPRPGLLPARRPRRADHPFFAHSPRWSTTAAHLALLHARAAGGAARTTIRSTAGPRAARRHRALGAARPRPVRRGAHPAARATCWRRRAIAWRWPARSRDASRSSTSTSSSSAARIPAVLQAAAACARSTLLKQAFADLLPPPVITAPKQPYRAPDSASFVADGEPLPYVAGLLAADARQGARLLRPERRRPPRWTSAKAGKTIGFGDNMAFVGILSDDAPRLDRRARATAPTSRRSDLPRGKATSRRGSRPAPCRRDEAVDGEEVADARALGDADEDDRVEGFEADDEAGWRRARQVDQDVGVRGRSRSSAPESAWSGSTRVGPSPCGAGGIDLDEARRELAGPHLGGPLAVGRRPGRDRGDDGDVGGQERGQRARHAPQDRATRKRAPSARPSRARRAAGRRGGDARGQPVGRWRSMWPGRSPPRRPATTHRGRR